METMTQRPDIEVIVRRIAVVDMIRGVALMLMTLGCVIVWFHKDFRLSGIPTSLGVQIAKTIAETGVAGLAVVVGLTVFFYIKYHFAWHRYRMVVVSLLIISLYKFLFSPFFLAAPWSLLAVVGVSLVVLGTVLGIILQNRMLLEADDYATFMQRKHDFRKVMLVFGQAPLFCFLAMLIFTQCLAWLTALLIGFDWKEINFLAGYTGLPVAFGYSLPRIYLIGFCMVGLLYPLCKGYSQLKNSYGWFRYF